MVVSSVPDYADHGHSGIVYNKRRAKSGINETRRVFIVFTEKSLSGDDRASSIWLFKLVEIGQNDIKQTKAS
jgi:hypothetical protein